MFSKKWTSLGLSSLGLATCTMAFGYLGGRWERQQVAVAQNQMDQNSNFAPWEFPMEVMGTRYTCRRSEGRNPQWPTPVACPTLPPTPPPTPNPVKTFVGALCKGSTLSLKVGKKIKPVASYMYTSDCQSARKQVYDYSGCFCAPDASVKCIDTDSGQVQDVLDPFVYMSECRSSLEDLKQIKPL